MWINFVVYMTRWSLLLDGEVQTTLYTCANAAKNNNHESFFYNKDSKVCIVNDIKIHTTNSLVPQTGFVYYVLHGPKCGPPPVIPNAVLEDVKYMSGDIYTAVYSCITGFYFPAIKTSTCSGTTWSTGVYCKALSSCSDIRTCNPSHSDGEYWLYPDVYDHKKVKIYCHGMDTGNPMEYMTLIRSNVMKFPLGKYRRNTGCLVTTSGSTKEGKTRFSRVRILPENMTIQSSDKRFSTQIYGTISLGYGHAAACSVYDTKICPLRGKSTIDITSTGLVFGSSNEWKGLGHFPSFDVVSHDHVIHVKADGGCGSAEPKSPIKLELDSIYRPSLDSATDPVCI